LALAAAAALFVWAMARHAGDLAHHEEGLDFQDYYYSAKAVRGGASTYDYNAMLALARSERGTRELAPHVYPPLLTALFVPLTRVPYVAARVAWLALNQLLLWLTVVACARICAARGATPPGPLFVLTYALLGACAFAPTLNHDWQGQSNTAVLALSAWALHEYLVSPRAGARAGLFLAPAILLKLFPGIFVPYLVVRRAWRPLAGTAVAAIAITVLSLVAVPWADYVRFPEVLRGSMYLKEGGSTLENYSMPVIARWIGVAAGAREGVVRFAEGAIRVVPYLLALCAAAWEARREAKLQGIARMVPALRLSQGFLLMGFLILKWWEHHLVFLLVPIFFAVRLAFFERAALRASRAGAVAVGALVVVSVLWIALPRHPLLWDALAGQRWAALRDALVESKRIGILLLGAATEVLIAQLKRASALGARTGTEAARYPEASAASSAASVGAEPS
jgi:hypothetical protein